MTRVQEALQRTIVSLRGLMTDLYPPDLHSRNVDRFVVTLAGGLRGEGVDVQLDLAEVPELSEEGAAILYQVARESLANVQKHAQATTVQVSLSVEDGLRPDQARVQLMVADDGVGVDPGTLRPPCGGPPRAAAPDRPGRERRRQA